MPLKDAKKACKWCRAPLVLKSSRDLGRKNYCSHSCRQKHRYEIERWPTPKKPKGVKHSWNKTFCCKLCGDKVLDGRPNQKWCDECVPSQKWRSRASRYGIGKKQWDALLEDQGGVCVLCENPPEVVDHNHETGVVRGLLCGSCNLRLSGIDDTEWLARAIEYARRA